MKKLLIFLALLLAPSAAIAQCNGAFPATSVCGTIAGGPPGPVSFSSIPTSLVIGTTPISPSNADVLFNNSGILGGSSVFTFTPTGGVILTPASGSNNPALTIAQTTPNTGSVAGPIFLNLLSVVDQAQSVTGSGIDAFGQITNQTDAFRLNYTVTGGSANHFGANFAANVTATNGGTVPLLSSIYVNVGPITGDGWVNIADGNVGPSGNLNQSLIGYEAEMLVADTGVLKDRIGFSANSQGPTVGTRYDEAVSINTFNLGVTHYLTGAPWSNGIHLNNGLYGGSFPIASTGSIILADTGTVANLISAHTLTVTGNVIDLPSVNITGAGSMTLGTGSVSTSNAAKVTCSTCGFVELSANANGTSNADGVLAADSSGNNSIFLNAFEAGSTISRFGQTTGNWAQYVSGGTTNVGMMIGTLTSQPFIIGTNNTARISISGAGTIVNIAAPTSVTSSSAGALAVGPNGTTNPTFQVDDSASSAANGVYVFSTAAGSGANITTISSATNETLKINAKGSGIIDLGGTSTGGVTVHTSFTATGLVTNADLVNPATTVNGQTCTLGSTCTVTATASSALTIGTHLTGTSYNGSTPITIATDATNANTASTIVARDGSGNFTAGTITASLTGHASLDLALTSLGTGVQTALGTAIGASGGLYTLGGAINTSPKTFLDINANTSTSPALIVSTSLERLQAPDTAAGGFEMATYGAGASGNIITGGAAGGTAASPTASVISSNMFNMRGYGYNAGWQLGGIWIITADEAWSSGHQGTRQDWYTTPDASTTIALGMSLRASGGLTVGSSFDPGIGDINANVGFYAGGTKGVTCSGALTVISSITVKGGIITAATGTGGTCS